jgi:hypothetical protein
MWDTVIPADLKRLFVSGTYECPAGHERVKYVCNGKGKIYPITINEG